MGDGLAEKAPDERTELLEVLEDGLRLVKVGEGIAAAAETSSAPALFAMHWAT